MLGSKEELTKVLAEDFSPTLFTKHVFSFSNVTEEHSLTGSTRFYIAEDVCTQEAELKNSKANTGLKSKWGMEKQGGFLILSVLLPSGSSLGSSRWCFSPALMSWLGGFVALKYLKWSFFHLWFWRFCFKGNLYFLRLLFFTRSKQILSHCLYSFHKSGIWDILASAFSGLEFIDLQHLPLYILLKLFLRSFGHTTWNKKSSPLKYLLMFMEKIKAFAEVVHG